MKKVLICLAALLMTALLLTACGGDDTPAPTAAPTEPPTQLHTLAPTQAEPAIEWAHIDCELTLEDNDNLYAKGSDFLSFALVGSGDDAEIRFRLDDVTAGMLLEQSPDNAYYITMNGKRLGDAKLNKSCDELTLVTDISYEKLCQLANRIRGLE